MDYGAGKECVLVIVFESWDFQDTDKNLKWSVSRQ